jgi:hypothetical protein
MTVVIPNDPEGRSWVEIGGANPDLVDSLRPGLVAFLAFDRDRVPKLAGTGFLVAAECDLAFVMTAKHVLTEGVVSAQRPHPSYAASALVVPTQLVTPSIDPKHLRLVWMGSRDASMLNVIHVVYNDSLDIAACLVAPEQGKIISEPRSIPLSTELPPVGELVTMVSLDALDVTETIAPSDEAPNLQALTVERRVSIRMGLVTAHFPQGLRMCPWPCFTTSIPAKKGMSGGFVSWHRPERTVTACGVVCADNSIDAAHADFRIEGESVVGCSWPALSLRLPAMLPPPPSGTTYTLLELMRRGQFPMPDGGLNKIWLQEFGNGDCTIGLAP